MSREEAPDPVTDEVAPPMDDGNLGFLKAHLPRFFGALPAEQLRSAVELFQRVSLASGEVLYRQGDPGDSLHLVITGRLRVGVETDAGKDRIVRLLRRGDCFGELSVLTGKERTATVVAIRDTVLASITRDDFLQVVGTRPEVSLHLATFGIDRLTELESERVVAGQVRTFALVGLDPEVPLAELASRLELALLRYGSTIVLDGHGVRHRLHLKKRAQQADFDTKSSALNILLENVEDSHRYVLYLADAEVTPWSRKCISQADRILFVASAGSSPELRPIERKLLSEGSGKVLAEKDLVLIHPGDRTTPKDTTLWLAPRQVDHHYHVSWAGNRSLHRLARLLAGRAVTLVLGGGGARGFAHVGAIRAIREAGIPIDAAVGTSIGACIAAMVALDWSNQRVLRTCKRGFTDERPLNDYTLPLFGIFKGDKLARALRRYVGDIDIVDMWAPYFCVSSNLSRSVKTVHRSGTLWKALRSSISLPGILPPFVIDGELHIDGGLMDNLPVYEMKRSITGRAIAIDTSVQSEYRVERDSAPSPFEYLRGRLSGRSEVVFPTLPEVIIKATTLGGTRLAEEARRLSDLYLNPPMQEIDLLDWRRFYDIVEIGYCHTREHLPAWIDENPDVVQREEMLEFSRLADT